MKNIDDDIYKQAFDELSEEGYFEDFAVRVNRLIPDDTVRRDRNREVVVVLSAFKRQNKLIGIKARKILAKKKKSTVKRPSVDTNLTRKMKKAQRKAERRRAVQHSNADMTKPSDTH